MWHKERQAWAKIVEEAHAERMMLLEQLQRMADRVQRPEILPPRETAPSPPPEEATADYSMVGAIVPDGVQVGIPSPNGDE